MDNNKEVFSVNLNRYMKIKNITQSDLINELGFDKSAVSTWVKGTRVPRTDKIKKIAEYLDIPVADLLFVESVNDDISVGQLRKDEIELLMMYRELETQRKKMIRRLFEYYKLLNDVGVKKADERMDELTQIPSYKKNVLI